MKFSGLILAATLALSVVTSAGTGRLAPDWELRTAGDSFVLGFLVSLLQSAYATPAEPATRAWR
jgi:ubiquinone biosynthesis protein UbiJ